MKYKNRHAVCYFRLFCVLLFVISACSSTNDEEPGYPKEIYVWSHNDYEQEIPLFQALDYGYQMIEADIHLIDGELYVSHDYPENLDETPVLEELYLDPLLEVIEKNDGVVLPESRVPFYLVIDVKSEAEPTFEALSNALVPYEEYFTRKVDGDKVEGPIHLLISGNRPELDENDPNRMAFIDGRVPDIGTGLSSELYPLISDRWFNYFSWDGSGTFPEEEREKLEELVNRTHAEDKMIRFWATPDKESVWDVLLDAGVDVINVDDLEKLYNYLQERYR